MSTHNGTWYREKRTKEFIMGFKIFEGDICSMLTVVPEFIALVFVITLNGVDWLPGLCTQLYWVNRCGFSASSSISFSPSCWKAPLEIIFSICASSSFKFPCLLALDITRLAWFLASPTFDLHGGNVSWMLCLWT